MHQLLNQLYLLCRFGSNPATNAGTARGDEGRQLFNDLMSMPADTRRELAAQLTKGL